MNEINEIFSDSSEICNNLKKLNYKFKNKKILITGSHGFIGVNFLLYFIYLNKFIFKKNRCRIYCIDNFKKKPERWIKNIINKDKRILQINEDITKLKVFPKVDYVIHAASIASPTFYRKFPLDTLDANVNGLRNLLEYYKNKKTINILYLSSSEIYGDPPSNKIPTEENYNGNVNSLGPRACYDESKRLGETLCYIFSKKFNKKIVIVRPFNNYGPGMNLNDKRIFPDFINNVLNNKNIKIYSSGSDKRTYCYISDAIMGYIRALLLGKASEAYNIGNNYPEISVMNLAKKILKNTKSDVKIEFVKNKDKEYLTHNPTRRCPNLDKSKKELNFVPKISLSNGIKKTFKFYNKLI